MTESDEFIAATTGFFQTPDGQWYWRTWDVHGECVGVGGDGETNLRAAVLKFFAAQGPGHEHNPDRNQTERHYSKLYKVTDTEYHIRRYAPQPY